MNLAAQKHLPLDEAKDLTSLIQLKAELSKKSQLKEFYRIQLHSGSRSEAEKIIREFNISNENLDSDIIYETPNFKVWIGFFRSRLDAERIFKDLKEDFPKAMIIKPGRN
jgi:hypothetical protein